MFGKINCRDIVRDHYQTLVRHDNGKACLPDYLLFVAAPLLAGVAVALARGPLTETAVNVLTNAMAILAGLLFNLLVLIHALARGFVGPTGSADSEQLIRQVYANIAYAILVSLITMGPLVVVGSLPSDHSARTVASAFSVALTLHFGLTLLMVLKRAHSLLRFDLRKPNG